MGKVPPYAIDRSTGALYKEWKWNRILTPQQRKAITSSPAGVAHRRQAQLERAARKPDAKQPGPVADPPPSSWLGTLEQWRALPWARRRLLRRKTAKRVFVQNYTTRCPVNYDALAEYLTWGCDKRPEMTKRLLTWDGVSRYWRAFGEGRRFCEPHMTMTTVNRKARGVAAEGTGLRDIDISNCQPTIAANIGWSLGMSETELEPLLSYITHRESYMLLVQSLTLCSKSDAKNVYITCVYGGDEWGWLYRHEEIESYDVKCALSDLVRPFRQCVSEIRKRAVAATPEELIKRVGTRDPKMLWYLALTRPEDRLLSVIAAALEERACRVCQLVYDGLFWMPPARRVESWSTRDDAVLERFVNKRLARDVKGMKKYPLTVKVKAFETPAVWDLVKGLRADKQTLTRENASLRERNAELEREVAQMRDRVGGKRVRRVRESEE